MQKTQTTQFIVFIALRIYKSMPYEFLKSKICRGDKN